MGSYLRMVGGGPAIEYSAGDAGATFTASASSATVYYTSQQSVARDSSQVGASGNADGSITAGSSVTLYGQQWFYVDQSRDPITNLRLNGDLLVAPLNVVGSITAPPKLTIGLLGDSITARNTPIVGSGASLYLPREGYFHWANARLGGRFQVVSYAGVSGETSAQILARVGAMITAAPGVCSLLSGTNDLPAATTAAQSITNIQATIDALVAAGILVVVGTITPRSDGLTTAQILKMHTINRWIKSYGRSKKGVIVVDWAPYLQDATGAVLANFTVDNLHPTVNAAMVMGQVWANTVGGLVPATDDLTPSNADAGNLILNGMMTGTAGSKFAGTVTPTGNVADSWTARYTGATGALACSKVARTDGVAGEWQRLALTAGVGQALLYQDIAGPAAGTDTFVQAEVRFPLGDFAAVSDFQVQLFGVTTSNVASSMIAQWSDVANVGNVGLPSTVAVFRTPSFIIPGTDTHLRARIVFTGTTATVDVGRVELRVTGT